MKYASGKQVKFKTSSFGCLIFFLNFKITLVSACELFLICTTIKID